MVPQSRVQLNKKDNSTTSIPNHLFNSIYYLQCAEKINSIARMMVVLMHNMSVMVKSTVLMEVMKHIVLEKASQHFSLICIL